MDACAAGRRRSISHVRVMTASGPHKSRSASEAASVPLAGASVLLAEDSGPLRFALCELLTGVGARVTACPDGEAARRRLAETPGDFDALVTDYDMPVLGGADLARAARALAPAMPVILCTALPTWTARAPEERALFDRVLSKPVTGADLTEALAALLAR